MALSSNRTFLRYVCALYDFGTFAGLSDGQLLERFVSQNGKAAELAFAALVERHGPMVLRVCRRVLTDRHDAEDAFQAVFLVLVRRAGSVRNRESVASWLYGVALRVAGTARSAESRRANHEQRAAERAAAAIETKPARDDLGPVLHEEIGRMPDRYRAAVVLCYLEGRTYDEAARVLGCPVGTVKSRLAAARETLRARLTRRGFAPVIGALGSVLAAETATAAVPRGLAEAAVRNALRLGMHRTMFAGTVSATIVALTEGAVGTMAWTKLHWITAVAMAIGVGGAGVGVVAQQNAVKGDAAVVVDGTSRPTNEDAGLREEHNVRFTATARSDRKETKPRKLTVEQKLNEPVSLDFDNVPLKEAVQWLCDHTSLNIVLDPKAVADRKLTFQAPVSLVASNIRLKSALKLLFQPLGLNYVIEDDDVVLTIAESPRGQLVTKTYYVGDLLPGPVPVGDQTSRPKVDMRPIIELISSSVAPGTWSVNDPSAANVSASTKDEEAGPSAITRKYGSITPFFLSISLIIRHTPEVHDRIANLLRLSRCLRYGSDENEKVGPSVAPAVNNATARKSEAPRSENSVAARTVYVPVLESAGASLEPKMSYMITELLMKEIERRTPYKVVNSSEEADLILDWSLRPRVKAGQSRR